MAYSAAQLTGYYTLVNQGVVPDAATTLLLNAYATEDSTGLLTDAQTLSAALHTAQTTTTTDVAVATYGFFTGTVPSAAGLAYLVNSPANTTDLNDSYYSQFNQENRYYNFAINLALTPASAAAAAFNATYNGLTLAQTIATAYETIVGTPSVGATAAAAAIASITASIPFFQAVAASRAAGFNQDLATKAIIVGYILEEAVKADVGIYAKAIDQFNLDVAGGVAIYGPGTNLVTTYSLGGAGYNIGVGGTGSSIGGTPGSTIAFTAGLDNLMGTANDDTFNAVVLATGGVINAGTGALLTTLQAGDILAGGGGNDTLNITVIDPTGGGGATGNVTIPGATVSGVRNIVVHGASSAAGDVDIVLANNYVGATQFVSDRSTNALLIGTNATTGALGSGQAVGVNGNGSIVLGSVSGYYANSVTAATINLTGGTGNAVPGSGPALTFSGVGLTTVTINSSGAANTVGTVVPTVTGNQVTTLNVVANTALTTGLLGSLGSTTANATETVNITGSAAVTFGGLVGGGGNVTTMNLNVNNGSTLNTGGITGLFTAGATLNVSGTSTATQAATASVALGVLDANVKTLNAGGLTAGGVSATIGANSAIAVTGGGGTDVITVAAGTGAALTGTINGGAGTDIFAVSTAADLTGVLTPLVLGFETLRVSNNTGGAQTYDPTLIGGINSYQVAASANNTTLINLVANAGVTVIGNVTGTLTLNEVNASGASDVVNLTLNNLATTGTNVSGITISNLALGGNSTPGPIETLNIISAGRVAGTGAYNTVNVSASGAGPNYLDAGKVVISGAAGLNYVTPLAMTHVQTIDASANTGGVNINGGSSGPNLLTVLGTGVNDTIIVGSTQALVYGGAGGDWIQVGGTFSQTIAYKASTDSQLDLTGTTGAGGNVGASGTGGTVNSGKMDIITGFVTGTDKIDVSALTFTGALAAGIADKGIAASDAQFTTILSTAGLFSDGVNTRGFAQIHGAATMGSGVAGDFLVIDVNKDGAYTAGTDIVVKLAGTASLAIGDLVT